MFLASQSIELCGVIWCYLFFVEITFVGIIPFGIFSNDVQAVVNSITYI